ncbi:MAG: adenine phosphoribosyltransferase [Flavobacteriaceae bacterium]|nr:adenine phosphoribosyltransferase [Flavobacteriaceae bacterium]
MMLQQKLDSHIRIIEDFPQKGISFKDFSGIFQNPGLSREIISEFASHFDGKVDLVCGIESRGFIFGFPLALELNVPFVMVRKKGKLPPPVVSATYQLEYGEATLEIVEGQIPKDARVLIHDDVLATGGTAAACSQLVKAVGAKPLYYSFLIELEFLNGRSNISNTSEIFSLISYSS